MSCERACRTAKIRGWDLAGLNIVKSIPVSRKYNEREDADPPSCGVGVIARDAEVALQTSNSCAIASQLGIVIPCYNESARLRVSEFEDFLDADRTQCTLIFVDDGSRDQTIDVLNRIRMGHEKRVVVLRQPENRGKAEAVRCGMNYALGQQLPFAGFWDADLATPLTAIASFVSLLTNQPKLDMILGARVKLLGHQIERKSSRHYAGRIFATAASTVLRLPVYDTQCGAKLFRCTPQMREVFEKPFLSRWIFDIEIIARYMSLMNSRDEAVRGIYEFPLDTWSDVDGSKLGPRDFARAAYDLVRIRGKYM
jgi:dolichyl-phosphate beta-glucosyltransferase